MEEAARERAASEAPVAQVEPAEDEADGSDEPTGVYQQAAEALHIPSGPSHQAPLGAEYPRAAAEPESEPEVESEAEEDEAESEADSEPQVWQEEGRITLTQPWAAAAVVSQEIDAAGSNDRETLQNPSDASAEVQLEQVRWEVQQLKDEVAQLKAEIAQLRSGE